MGRWRTSLLFSRFAADSFSQKSQPNFIFRRLITPLNHSFRPNCLTPTNQVCIFRPFNSYPSAASPLFDLGNHNYYNNNEHDEHIYDQEYYMHNDDDDDAELAKISVKAIFLCTSVDLKGLQVEMSSHVVRPTSRSTNHTALRFCKFTSDYMEIAVEENLSYHSYMVVFQYGSAVLFNMEDNEIESYLNIIKRHATGVLKDEDTRKDDYIVKEKPLLTEDMQAGPDYIVLKNLDIDSIRIISSVLGQSIALDYFVSQVDGMVEEFTDINRLMEKTGTFTMERKKLFQLVGKANSNLADVILKVGIFDRSEIAWRDAKYAQIYEYLREEYEVTQRFGNLDYKLKFVEHNIHFLQEALQNRKSDLLEWCIIVLLSIENIIGLYEIIREANIVTMI
uniref:protein RETARDED ROOT GROWTH, mitochondrial-like n=1 Tax=Erigeron canadensis TaxID=72917 RepID=UPI001CB91F76|nr:protein RETARDED ROOT GROWTH, mitochondrial-like [Erigeron canadensis]